MKEPRPKTAKLICPECGIEVIVIDCVISASCVGENWNHRPRQMAIERPAEKRKAPRGDEGPSRLRNGLSSSS